MAKFRLYLYFSLLAVIGAGCEKSIEVPSEKVYPVSIVIDTNGVNLLDYQVETVCNRYGAVLTNVNYSDYKYIATTGWNFFGSGINYGHSTLAFLGSVEQPGILPTMKEIVSSVIENEESDIIVVPEIILSIDGSLYKSVLLDRSYSRFEYLDPNRVTELSLSVEQPLNCAGWKELLSFNYKYQGYIYNQGMTDSLYLTDS